MSTEMAKVIIIKMAIVIQKMKKEILIGMVAIVLTKVVILMQQIIILI